jgi:hypothetical protein
MYIYREEREICCARATAMLYATPESHLCEIEEGRAGEVKEAKQESYGKRVKVSVVMTMFVVCDFFRAFFQVPPTGSRGQPVQKLMNLRLASTGSSANT